MRILFTVIPEKGHLNPYIPVAQALQSKGHTVAFHAAADIRPQLTAAGLPLFLGEPAHAEPPAISRGRSFASNIGNAQWLRQWIKTLLVDNVPAAVEPLRQLVREFAPDVIITDPMLYQSVIVAEQECIKWAAVSNSLNPVLNPSISSELLETVAWLSPARAALFSAYGLQHINFRGCDSLSPYLTTCFTTSEFTGYEVPGVSLVGPACMTAQRGDETDFPWHKLREDKKKIFVSFGSQIYYQPDRFRKITQAFAHDRDVQLILSVSELLDSHELGTLPENAIAVRYAPQLELLPHIDLFITHGGANSVMEALSFGTPLLIAPICNDQFHQAWFIKNAGVGEEIRLEDVEPVTINQRSHAILHDESLRGRVSRIQRSYQTNGSENTATFIERLFPC